MLAFFERAGSSVEEKRGMAMLLLTTVALAGVPAEVQIRSRGIANVADALKSLSATQATAAQAPNPIPVGYTGDWITSEDYPPPALIKRSEGRTSFSLSVGPDGKVTDCAIKTSSGSDLLDQTTCKLLMRRAVFKPAHDISGKAVASTYSSAVIWQIPKAPPVQISPMDMLVAFDVDQTGKVSGCMTSGTSQGGSPMAIPLALLCDEISGAKVVLPSSTTSRATRRVTTRVIVTVSDLGPPRIDTPSPHP